MRMLVTLMVVVLFFLAQPLVAEDCNDPNAPKNESSLQISDNAGVSQLSEKTGCAEQGESEPNEGQGDANEG